MAGEHGPVTDALERLVAAAIHEIDMDVHTGEHPRIGAVDVIPFVPLAATTMDDCVELARAFGRADRDRFDLPVFLYAKAAPAPGAGQARRRPPRSVRGPERRDRASAAASRTSDRRGCTRRPGAVAVGARPFLIAYNINLESRDVELAKRIARRVRESGGGLPAGPGERLLDRGARRAPGVDEPARLRDHADVARLGDGPRRGGRGWRRPRRIRADRARPAGGVPRRRRPRRSPAEDPIERRLAAAAAFLRLRDFSPMQALELRLEAARAETAPR